jgi:hypothetical protein
MSRFLSLLLFVWAAAAQTPDPFNQPPADVDKALRARITEFFQLHVEAKFRQAEALVAEDTKDFFYTSNKPKYLSFEIRRIDYSDGFTKAKATVLCEQYVMIPGFTEKPVKVPVPSTWKLVDGAWYWYVDQESLRQSPFGKMTPGTAPASGPIPNAVPGAVDMKYIFTQVKADKQQVTLKPGEEEKVVISNGAQGRMNLSLAGAVPGVEAKLDRTEVNAGEKATLTLHAGKEPKPGMLNVRVEQTSQLLPVQIKVE